MRDVCVLVPGIMGSVLVLNDEIVWPGTVTEFAMGYDRL
jgi:hypothetical protein